MLIMLWCLAGIPRGTVNYETCNQQLKFLSVRFFKCLELQECEEPLSLWVTPNVPLSHCPTSAGDQSICPGKAPQGQDKPLWCFSVVLPQHATGSPEAKGYFSVFSVSCGVLLFCYLVQCPLGLVYTFIYWKSSGRQFHSFNSMQCEETPPCVVSNLPVSSFDSCISFFGRVCEQLICPIQATQDFINLSHVHQLFHAEESYSGQLVFVQKD